MMNSKRVWVFRAPFSVKRILLALFGLAFLVLFFGGFLFAGWQDIEVRCVRSEAGAAPSCHIREKHFMNLYVREADATGVTGVGYRVSRSSSQNMSTVVLSANEGEVPLTLMSSNVDDNPKKKAIQEISEYLDTPGKLNLDLDIRMVNIFAYIGLPGSLFVLWVVYGSVAWLVFPARLTVDNIRRRVWIRAKGGEPNYRELGMDEIAGISVVKGEKAYKRLFPKLSRWGGANHSAPPSVLITLASGEEIVIPNFVGIPEDRLRDIISEIWDYTRL